MLDNPEKKINKPNKVNFFTPQTSVGMQLIFILLKRGR